MKKFFLTAVAWGKELNVLSAPLQIQIMVNFCILRFKTVTQELHQLGTLSVSKLLVLPSGEQGITYFCSTLAQCYHCLLLKIGHLCSDPSSTVPSFLWKMMAESFQLAVFEYKGKCYYSALNGELRQTNCQGPLKPELLIPNLKPWLADFFLIIRMKQG